MDNAKKVTNPACFRVLFFVHGQLAKNITEASRMADLHGVVEVFHELCVPHFYHGIPNSLIINELHILHREMDFCTNNQVTFDYLFLLSILRCDGCFSHLGPIK